MRATEAGEHYKERARLEIMSFKNYEKEEKHDGE